MGNIQLSEKHDDVASKRRTKGTRHANEVRNTIDSIMRDSPYSSLGHFLPQSDVSTGLTTRGGFKVLGTPTTGGRNTCEKPAPLELLPLLLALILRRRSRVFSSRRNWLPRRASAFTTSTKEHATNMAAKRERNFLLERAIILLRFVVFVVVFVCRETSSLARADSKFMTNISVASLENR